MALSSVAKNNPPKHLIEFKEIFTIQYDHLISYICENCGKHVVTRNRPKRVTKLGIDKLLCKKCRCEATNLLLYGKEYFSQTEESKAKFKRTCISKYGYDNHMKNENVRNKSLKTRINFSEEKKQEIIDKRKSTCNLLYNGPAPAHSEEIIER